MGQDMNGYPPVGGVTASARPRVQRYRQLELLLPAELADHLQLQHRAIVADAIRTGQAAPDFNGFLTTLLQLGYQAVMATPDPAPSPAPTEAPDADADRV